MQEEKIIYHVRNLYNEFLEFFYAHTAEFIFSVLALSIGVVFISILYVLINNDNKETVSRKHAKKKAKKPIKIKYSKDFLRRVDGVDLSLK